jgi:hypothetical protein
MVKNDLTAFERMEVQMEFVVPLLRDLQEILGEDVVNQALEQRTQLNVERARMKARPPRPVGESSDRLSAGFAMYAAGEALDVQKVVDTDDEVGFDVARCSYAEMMERMGATDLGFLMICAGDYPDAARGAMQLDRSQTKMQGASHCDFRFRSLGGAGDGAEVGVEIDS